jgi:hypothetical protein
MEAAGFKITLYVGLSEVEKTTLYGFGLDDLAAELRHYPDHHKYELIGLNDKYGTELSVRRTYESENCEGCYLDFDSWAEEQFDPLNNPKHRGYKFSYTDFVVTDDVANLEASTDWEEIREVFIKRAAKRGHIKVVYQEEWDKVFTAFG